MAKKTYSVLVTRKIPQSGLDLLSEKCELEVYPEDRPIPRQELLRKITAVDGLLCLLSDSIDRDVLDAAPRLKVVSNYAVGYNNIDVEYATRKGVVVTNTPGVLTDATADLAWALLLAVARRLVEGDRMVRQGKFQGWGPMLLLGRDLRERTLGIVGAGRIGTAVAERSRGWKMRLLYFSRRANEYLEKELGAERVSLEKLLAESDFVSLHVPLTPHTHHLIDEAALRRMKPTAILINTARGAVVDEQALVKVLQERRIAGAGLDVYEHEPRVHPELLKLDNVVLLPHIGSATVETRDEMARIAARNLLAVLEGKEPEFPVNPQVLATRRAGSTFEK